MLDIIKSVSSNTIRLPSGDHEGELCPPAGFPVALTCLGWPPSDDTIQIVEGASAWETKTSPGWPDWNAIIEPSGDHEGLAPNSVSCLGLPPRLDTNQMPPRFRE